ncbi:MAG TPA: carboxypeptidase regulatory-like domain-containing protein [Gemmatimonadaceae bacterium]|nr:carboxypeptidase regulatory-like domain-containing protein [Gemmatimonadaceae bacterium]
MRLRSIILAIAVTAMASTLSAQEVLVEVVELSTGKPIVGASVSLLDDHGNNLLGNFSDQGGHTVLPASRAGTYVVRADKVGYDTWNSVVLHVGGEPIHVRVGMALSRNPSTVVARSESSCQLLTGPGTASGDLWVEIKKALTASALTEARGFVPLDVVLYERTLDRNLGVLSERTEQRSRLSRRPSVGITWDQVDSSRQSSVSGGDVYRAPDAATLVSDQFVKTHCYSAIRGYGPETGLAGLEFKPARIGSQPELTGVLWLDPKTNTLRSLNFDYVNLPIPLRVARTSGRVEFQELPSGQWIVPRWYIRMPRVSRIVSTDVRSPAVARDTLLGYQEVGGASRPAGTGAPIDAESGASQSGSASASSEAAPAAQSLISGIVYDSTTERGLGGVQVSTGGGRFRTTTTAGGHYELAVDGALNDTITFDHPRLRLYRIAERRQLISLPAGARGVANLVVPSYGTIRTTLCGRNETSTDAQGIVTGYVRDAAGNPVPHAHVWATWQILWIEQNGRLVSTNQQRTVETDTGSDGSYLMCGFTKDARITAKVGIAGRSTVQEKIALPATMVLEHDFVIGAR